jgi:glycosyltransferase involved in cell wall biosynthesis
MQSPQISVLMLTWNSGQFLAESLESILSQSFTGFELIVVDGGSTDGTLKILAECKDSRLRLFHLPGSGIVPARNFGIEQARAPWIAVQDADDISLPRRLEIQWNALNRISNPVLCYTDAYVIGDGADSVGRARLPRTQALFAMKLCYQCPVVHSTAMFKKATALAAGNYKWKYAEDFGLYGRLIENGHSIGIPKKLAKYRLHAVSSTQKRMDVMNAMAEEIAIEHCQKFMRLSPEEARRAYATLVARDRGDWKDWSWFLCRCAPCLRWKSAELFAWLGWQTLKSL